MEDTLLLSGRACTAYGINYLLPIIPIWSAVDALIAATNASKGNRQAETIGLRLEVAWRTL
ncbi:MAG TPA: hypothetical protein VGA01_17300, partial [Candidatus Binatia bacterium]